MRAVKEAIIRKKDVCINPCSNGIDLELDDRLLYREYGVAETQK